MPTLFLRAFLFVAFYASPLLAQQDLEDRARTMLTAELCFAPSVFFEGKFPKCDFHRLARFMETYVNE